MEERLLQEIRKNLTIVTETLLAKKLTTHDIDFCCAQLNSAMLKLETLKRLAR